MLNEQKLRVTGSKMITIDNSTYPNILDAVKFYYGFSGVSKEETPEKFKVCMNLIYLDRLEEFLKDELDLPGFYAFVEGRNGAFRDFTGFPMADIAMEFIVENIQEGNQNEESTRKYHDRGYHARFNRFGSSMGNRREFRAQQSQTKHQQTDSD